MIKISISAIIFLLICFAPSHANSDEPENRCDSKLYPPIIVQKECTAIIDSVNTTVSEKATALRERGRARRELISSPDSIYYRLALQDFEDLSEISIPSGEFHYDLARTHQKAGNFFLAIDEYDLAITMDTPVARWWIGRGLAQAGLGKTSLALEDIGRAIALEPQDPEGYYARAMVLFRARDIQSALRETDQAIERSPRHGELRLVRAKFRMLANDFRGAIEDYDRFIDENVDVAHAYYSRGLIHEMIGNQEEAMSDFGTAARLSPQNSEFLEARNRLKEVRREGRAD